MTRTITAHEATVKTAAVDVRALTISGRQVTLSVFRQLRDEPILDEDTAQLRGVPWGIVNYFWGDCAKASEHLHVVWQKADQLRRACVFPDPSTANGWQVKDELLAKTALWLAILRGENTALNSMNVLSRPGYGDRVLSVDMDYRKQNRSVEYVLHRGHGLPGEHPKTLLFALFDAMHTYSTFPDHSKYQYEGQVQRSLEKLRKEFNLPRVAGTSQQEELLQRFFDAFEARRDFAERWSAQYRGLSELDHLFIAV